MPAPVLARLSKRSEEIDQLEEKIVAKRKQEDKYAPDHLSAVEKDMLGATSRRQKRDDLTLDECREYWQTWYADDAERHRRGDPAGDAGPQSTVGERGWRRR